MKRRTAGLGRQAGRRTGLKGRAVEGVVGGGGEICPLLSLFVSVSLIVGGAGLQ